MELLETFQVWLLWLQRFIFLDQLIFLDIFILYFKEYEGFVMRWAQTFSIAEIFSAVHKISAEEAALRKSIEQQIENCIY